jgi:actin-related protein 10
MESGFKALGSEEEAVVLEIGTFYTKCGIGKETFPRAMFKNPSSLLALNHSSTCDEYYEVLRDFLNLIYYHKVQVNPKDSITVLCESLMAPRGKIEAIVKILFEDLQVLGVCLMLEESLPLYTTGLYTGLMVDSGFNKTKILPVMFS